MLLVLMIWLLGVNRVVVGIDPTDGFTQLAFSCEIQKPYDVAVGDRFDFLEGVYNLWVFSSDKPYMEDSPTMPRAELRIAGLDYSSGVWQFEGDFFVASTVTGVCIMQIFGGTQATATALQLRVVNGNLLRYGGGLPTIPIASRINDRWARLNVIHNADLGTIQIFIDKVLLYSEDNDNYKPHYFKCGTAYTQDSPSSCLETKWKNIAIWKKSNQVKREIPLIGGTASCFPQ
ncbi:hypothetical protein GOP47_0003998 [Adiantum capillus-veneris]|uniref:Alginate lyase 2 domain-containing protein n=1 Tax=Adiantum capillus-veneris TaxID=13818 RepID=A0A9D4ZPY7_ADICA|nr:hypothetical protein GOP47_0003998 [Adiantum capillus-veneris]